jgi:hypothetical protein
MTSPGPVVTAIFWGPKWSNNATFVGDKISGLDLFYSGIGNSNYASTCSEYTASNNPSMSVSNSIAYTGHVIDGSNAPSNGNSTSRILSEVCRMIPNPVSNGYYPVYIDNPRIGNYCAWHSSGSCGGVRVQFAFFYSLDGDAGCSLSQTQNLTHSAGLAALANVSGHELSEARTDPHLNAWYDSSGQENADKCAWTFSGTSVSFPNSSSQWTIQGNWSNAAYSGTATAGYAKGGCVDGNQH